MAHFEWDLLGADGKKLYGQGWQPETLKGVVTLVHGLGEHSGRYAHVADFLGQAGYAMLTFDLRGHGKTAGPRGDARLPDILSDIECLLVEARRRWPGKPLFLYGHSLGGSLGLYFTLQRKPRLNGVIATAPVLKTPLEKQKAKVALAKLLASLLPHLILSSGLKPQDISRDPSVVEAYRSDPLVHDKTSLSLGRDALAVGRWALAHAGEFASPLLLMQASADRLVYPEGSQQFAKMVQGDVTLKIWDGLYHEIHNEPEKEDVLRFLVDWLDRHLT
jgi:alpha-beta hydrolase superfamily lysophospholipase